MIDNSKEIKMITIRVKEKQAQVIMDALDLYQRLLMGQFQEIDSLFVHNTQNMFWKDQIRRDTLKSYLGEARKQIFPELDHGAYYSVLDTEHTPDVARVAYDIRAQMDFVISWHRHPGGRITTNFDKPYHSVQSIPLPIVEVEDNHV
jgi:hypothetical protein